MPADFTYTYISYRIRLKVPLVKMGKLLDFSRRITAIPMKGSPQILI